MKLPFKSIITETTASKREFKLAHLGLVVFGIKLFFFFLDPLPQFFMGDSQSYIATALTGWIPPDRSFVYGFLIRYLTSISHSLTSVVLSHIVATTLSCLLLAYLLKLAGYQNWIIITAALACALDPLNLLYERYVMTESFSLISFSFFIFCWFRFLRQPRWFWVVLAHLAGIISIALRLNFLPIVQLGMITFPCLLAFQENNTITLPFKTKLKLILCWLSISFCCFFVFHNGYKYINGYLSNSKPAYNYESGFFLLASWSPLLYAEDFPDPDMASQLLPNTYKELVLRESNRWAEDGIVSRLIKISPDKFIAEHHATIIAKNVLFRDPWGIVKMGLITFYQLWNNNYAIAELKYDRGVSKLPSELIKELSENYHLDASKLPFLNTVTNRHFFNSLWWYRLLLCSPVFLSIGLACARKEERPFFIFLVITTGGLLLMATMLVTKPVFRYLHPFGWMLLIGISAILRKTAELVDNKILGHVKKRNYGLNAEEQSKIGENSAANHHGQ